MGQLEITDVEALYVRNPEMQDRTDSSQDALIIRVSTSAGVTGYGEVDGGPMATKGIVEGPFSHKRASGLRRVLMGQNPLDIRRLWEKMYESTLYYGRSGAVIQAMAGIDLALWDIAGKVYDQPVSKLLGGGFRDHVRAYASHMFPSTSQQTEEIAAQAVAAGFTAVKFGWEPFGADAAKDVEFVAAVRSGAGDDADIMIDAGLAWDAKTAIQRIRSFEPYHLFWVEEPLHPDDVRGYRDVTRAVTTRVAAGEEECTVEGFLRLMDDAAIDVVQIDVTRVGLTQALHIAGLASDRGLPVATHTFTTDINHAASLHFMASIPNALILEFCVEQNEFRSSLVRNPIELKNGSAVVPTQPGLGIDVDEEAISKFLVP